MHLTIHKANSTSDIQIIYSLLLDYGKYLGNASQPMNWHDELTHLPQYYASPRGLLLYAELDNTPCGCIGLKPIEENSAEIKRLFVVENFRQRGVASALLKQLISEAATLGYGLLRLDLLSHMDTARRLYRGLGFNPVPAYYNNPKLCDEFMELLLTHPDPVL